MSKRNFFSAGMMAVLILFFNNCSPFRATEEGSSSYSSTAYQAVCDGQLKAAFQRTYHPFLTKNCNACHSMAHGSTDLTTSYKAFKLRGETLIDYQSTHAHGGNNFSSAMQPEIDAFKPAWKAAQDEYVDCLAQGAAQGTGSGSFSDLKTKGKVIPGIMNTLNNSNWIGVEWDLESETEGRAAGVFKAVLRVEARLNRVNGLVGGLLIRNPTLKLKDGSANIQVSGLMIVIDNDVQTAVTTYSGISKIVNSKTAVSLVSAAGAAYASDESFVESTLVGFEFNEIRHTTLQPDVDVPPVVGTPTPVPIPDVPIPSGGVTHSQLTSSTSPYRVFNRSCVGCHNSGSGRLDLTNYDMAKAAASTIVTRMNSTASPMPPTGLLRQNDRDMVQSWVNAGTPK